MKRLVLWCCLSREPVAGNHSHIFQETKSLAGERNIVHLLCSCVFAFTWCSSVLVDVKEAYLLRHGCTLTFATIGNFCSCAMRCALCNSGPTAERQDRESDFTWNGKGRQTQVLLWVICATPTPGPLMVGPETGTLPSFFSQRQDFLSSYLFLAGFFRRCRLELSIYDVFFDSHIRCFSVGASHLGCG